MVDRSELAGSSVLEDSADHGEQTSTGATPSPSSEQERVLVDIWKTLLKVDDVDRSDDFFARGGDSLLMARMLGHLRKRGWTARIQDVSTAPVLSDLAGKLTPFKASTGPRNRLRKRVERITPEMVPLADIGQDDIDRIVERVPGGAANVQDIYGVLPMQAAFLYHNRRAPQRDPYVVIDHFRCQDRGTIDRMIAAYQAAVDRHDVLRSAFFSDTAEPVQVVLRKATMPVIEISDAISITDLRALLTADPMGLEAAPLLRCYAAPAPAGDGWHFFVMKHHIVGDHVSFNVVHDEVAVAMGVGHRRRRPDTQPFREAVVGFRGLSGETVPDDLFTQLGGGEPAYALDAAVEPDAPLDLSHRSVDNALYDRLKDHARILGVSMASLCHLAWGLVLARAAGAARVVTGSVFLGRARISQGDDPIMGPMINTLPVGIDIDGRGTVEGVRVVHATLARLLDFEQVPFDVVQRQSGLATDALPFTALLNYRHSEPPLDTHRAGYQHLVEDERATFPLTCSIDDYGDALSLIVQVAGGLEAARISRALETALLELAETLDTAPDRPLSELDCLPPEDRREILETWNQTETPFPSDRRIHEIFQDRVAETPDAIAVMEGISIVSYADLDRRSDRIARWLKGRGVENGDHVALLLERGTALIAAELAVSKVGGIYVPLDPTMPASRMATILSDCRAKAVIVDQATGRSIDPGQDQAAILFVDDVPVDGQTVPFDAVSGDGSAPVYVMYTSGSTGIPKGVSVAHRGIARLAVGNRMLPVARENRFAFASNPSFDASTFEIWCPLLNGASLVVLDRATVLSTGRLSAAIVETGIDTLWMTAGLFNQMAVDLVDVFPRLATLIVGGDVADRQTVHKVARDHAPARFLNGYGPTEATTFSALFEIGADLDPTRSVPIGPPMSNTRAYILDPERRPVPVGAVGELFLGGPGIGLGYLNRPDLTRERFHEDPFAPADGIPLYQTGDLVRWLPNGVLEYRGRKDHQVKIRGFRVELDEIRTVLLRHPTLADAVVVAQGEAGTDRRLVAYVVPQGAYGETLQPRDLRDHMAAALPGYMVPQAFVVMERLPLTTTGKVDRRALPEPGRSAIPAREPFASPEGETEEALAEVLGAMLGVDTLGRHDDIFDLGAHSLLILKLLTRIRAAFGIDLTPEHVFAAPTLKHLAAVMERGVGPDETTTASAPIPVVPRGDNILFPSHSQERLWFLSHLDGADEAYAIPMAVVLTGSLNIKALQRSVQALFARHEALRTVFIERDGRPVTSFLPPTTEIAVSVSDRRGHGDRETLIGETVNAEWGRRFDLAAGPLIRAQLVQLADDDYLFVLTQHHSISDGWSLDVIGDELGRLYRTALGQAVEPLAPLPLAFQDYADWQRDQLSTHIGKQQADYWRATLGAASMALELPTDRPRPERQDFSATSVPILIPARLVNGLEDLAKGSGTTLFVVMLTAWSLVFARCAAQKDVIVGIPTANRPHPDLAGIVGFFANTLAIRTVIDDTEALPVLLGRVHQTVTEGLRHQELPFDTVVDLLHPVRRLDRMPICQVMFSWQVGRGFPLALPGVEVSHVTVPAPRVKFDLHLDLTQADGVIDGHLNVATALFDPSTAQRHADYLLRLLQDMVEAGNRPAVMLDMLPAAVRDGMIAEALGSQVPFPQADTVGDLFEHSASTVPKSIAVRFGDRSMTYRDLDVLSNRLATQLVDLTPGPGSIVGVSMARSPAMVIALVGILKAGLAFLPLEPDLPQERLRRMCELAGPAVVLCDETGADRVADIAAAAYRLDSETGAIADHPWSDGPVTRDRSQDDLAYVIFTSGSTGEPKGVMIEQRSLVNHLTWIQKRYALTPEDVVVQKTPLSFDVSVWEVLWPLLNGATLAILPPGSHKDPKALATFIDRYHVTVAHFVPSMMAAFLRCLGAGDCVFLRRIFLGGEEVSAQLVRSVQGALPQASLTNFYGPSECTIEATSWDIPDDFDGDDVPIGRPISNMAAYVLDLLGRPVPQGTTGELYLSGAGVSRGYVGRPDLTDARFGADPFVPGRRMYRTGDLVRRRADGSIVFVGRTDTQEKLRGYRIEVSEVEQVLLAHRDIVETVVMIRTDPGTEKRLVAYVVASGTVVVEPTDLRHFVLGHVPDYMVPVAFVRLDTLPLTASGKLDRRSLPPPGRDDFCLSGSNPPETKAERDLAMIWSRLLGINAIGRDDDFFALGGNSLLSMQVVHQAHDLGLKLRVSDLIARPVLSHLAALAQERHQSGNPEGAISHGEYRPIVPLTFGENPVGTVIAFPGAGMGATAYRHFAAAADGRVSVVGLDPAGLTPGQMPFATVDQAAECFAAAIEAARLRGPIHLVGHSFGAFVSVETAHRLIAAGCVPDSMTLFDPPGPNWVGQPALEIIRHDFAVMVSHALSCPFDPAVFDAVSDETARFISVLAADLIDAGAISGHGGRDALAARFETYRAARQAPYKPRRPYPHPVRIILAGDDATAGRARIAPWGEWLPLMTILDAPGGHQSMLLSPQVRTLFQTWQTICQAAPGTSSEAALADELI